MSKLSLVDVHRILVNLFRGNYGFIQSFPEKSIQLAPYYVYRARSLADQKGFGERKIIAQNRTIQLH